MTPLARHRLKFTPPLAQDLSKLSSCYFQPLKEGTELPSSPSRDTLKTHFPHTFAQVPLLAQTGPARPCPPLHVGVVFSGGQAAGGHNVLGGLLDALHQLHPDSHLYGFLGGPQGIVDNRYRELTQTELAPFRNQGGFDLIGSGRTKLKKRDQLSKAKLHLERLKLNGLVIIGGDDSNTNAAILAEYLLDQRSAVSVVGVPKTIDGDLQNRYVEISFGFDSACKTYAELIGNIGRDVLSAKKYIHFVKLMGRSASHITLECALKTRPNFTLIGEELQAQNSSLDQLVTELACAIIERACPYGVVLIPEGLLESIPQMSRLIEALNDQLGQGATTQQAIAALAPDSLTLFQGLPTSLQEQLLLERDPHGNVQLSHIATEQLLSDLVHQKIISCSNSSFPFRPVHHFFGYEGRSCLPSNFDATYCYNLGLVTALLVRDKHTGYMSYLRHLHQKTRDWHAGGVPITSLMQIESRDGEARPVVAKKTVDLQSPMFQAWVEQRALDACQDNYLCPGPIQFEGPHNLTDAPPLIVQTQADTPSRSN